MFLKLFFFTLMSGLSLITIFPQSPPLEPGVSQKLAKWRAANYSDLRYKLNITLEKGAPLMKGEIEIRVKITDEGAKNDLILDWRTTQFANDKDQPYANVTAVNDAPDTLTSQLNEHIRIPKGLLKTGKNVIKIEFASPIKTSGAAVTRYVDKEDGAEYIYSMFAATGASAALPVFDQPDLKAEMQLTLTIPKDWELFSNTALDFNKTSKSKKDLTRTYTFKEIKTISPNNFAFAAGDFEVFSDRTGIKNSVGKSAIASSEILSKEQLGTLLDLVSNHIYVRKSQAANLKQYADNIFSLNPPKTKSGLINIVLLPDLPADTIDVYENVRYINENSVIK